MGTQRRCLIRPRALRAGCRRGRAQSLSRRLLLWLRGRGSRGGRFSAQSNTGRREALGPIRWVGVRMDGQGGTEPQIRAWPQRGNRGMGRPSHLPTVSLQARGSTGFTPGLSVCKCWRGGPGGQGRGGSSTATPPPAPGCPALLLPPGKSKRAPWWLSLPPTSFPQPRRCLWDPALHPAARSTPEHSPWGTPASQLPRHWGVFPVTPHWKNSHPLSAPRSGAGLLYCETGCSWWNFVTCACARAPARGSGRMRCPHITGLWLLSQN